jgi:ArsR family transcriptional regulator
MTKNYENNMALYERQADLCYALSHPIRLYILDLLSQDEMSSTQLLEVLDIPKANLSQHLSVLKEAGILKTRKEGTYQLLSLALPKIKDACQLVRGILADRLNEEQKQMKELSRNLELQKKKSSKKMIESRK